MKNSIGRASGFRKNHEPSQAEAPEQPAAAPQAGAAPGRRKRRLGLFLLACLLGSAAVSFVAFKYIAPSILAPSIPSELVGTWRVEEGNLKGATLEFSWYGTAVATEHKKGKTEITNSAVKVEGRKIFLTSKDADTGKEDTVTQTIARLTEDELVIRDEDQNVYRMIRVGR